MSALVADGFDVLASLVAQQVAASRGVSSGVGIPTGRWPPPEPLRTKLTAEPYPIDALPDSIRLAVQEVEGFVKAPLALVAGSALASISLAAQAHIDVERADKLCGPTGLFFLTDADSGERKTSCDSFFSQPISAFEAAKRIDMQPVLNTHRSSLEAWESKRAGVKERIKNLAKNQKPTGDMELALLELEKTKPQAPRIPRLTYADATPEALAYGLAHHWPSGGVMSSEAGVVLGSHGMGKDSVMRNLGLLNQLWDGKALTVDRRSTESFTVAGARLTIGLQVQEPTLTEFFSRTGALSRGTGFLARFLLAWPPSTQGQRPFTQAPTHWPYLTRFHDRLRAILESTAPVNERGELTPQIMRLSAQAHAAWVDFHNAVEAELASGGELYDVRDVASKSADNAARLAALFQAFDQGFGEAISLEAMERATTLAAWHLSESRRFFGELALPAELADATRLDCWLIDYCQSKAVDAINKNQLRQYGPLRDGSRLDHAIQELAALERVLLTRDGKRLTVHINPALLSGTS